MTVLPLEIVRFCRYRGGKYTFWQGGVRGNAFIHSPLLPAAMTGAVWHGLADAADWYA